ncbi:hypothetical protein [Rasiella sp. SM2506]|uniref:hypothetical protein n=1 Tax=Rasiella sp. SM2506 TaxID=3423914 RepID=UPI003D7BB767
MAQDIRKLLKNRPEETGQLSANHTDAFLAKLEANFPEDHSTNSGTRNVSVFWLKVAAIAIVFLAVSFFGYQYISGLDGGASVNGQFAETTSEEEKPTDILKQPKLTLGDLSPDLKKVEDFYLTGINVQLASLDENDDNKELIEGYKKRIAELDVEYNRLNNELTDMGPTEATINALIDNLKIRLDLLFKLKNKLKELKNLDNEKFNDLQA